MSFNEFRDKVKRYAAKAKINANRIEFTTDEGVHTARCNGVTMIGGTANSLVKIRWGGEGRKVSAIYGRPHESIVAM
jgi:hypothetical protein